jgi:hypothetical protein
LYLSWRLARKRQPGQEARALVYQVLPEVQPIWLAALSRVAPASQQLTGWRM